MNNQIYLHKLTIPNLTKHQTSQAPNTQTFEFATVHHCNS